MPGKHTEQAFESAIENHLLTKGGYIKGNPDTYDPTRAFDPTVLLNFIKETQPEKWEYIKNYD